MSEGVNSYQLSRSWFDFCFNNPEKISPNHTAIYFFAIEHCNRLGWKEKFGFPTQMTMDAIGIKKHQTYIKYFNELVDWGFFKLIQKSTNQYSANIISLQIALAKNGKALDKAFITHAAKQTEPNGQSNHKSNSSIDKQITNNNEQDNQEQENRFLIFGEKSDFFVSVKTKYTTDKPKTIYNLRLFFNSDQLEMFEKNKWNKFEEFMKDNPGRVFDDDNHVYNTFKSFHLKSGSNDSKTRGNFQKQNGGAGEKFSGDYSERL